MKCPQKFFKQISFVDLFEKIIDSHIIPFYLAVSFSEPHVYVPN